MRSVSNVNKKPRNLNPVLDEEMTLFNLERTNLHEEAIIETVNVKNKYFHQDKLDYFQLQNRRYIGSKHKLIEWIFSTIKSECAGGSTFADIFAGTGIVAAVATRHFEKIIVNDFLFSNYAIYQAFLGNGNWDRAKIEGILRNYNKIEENNLTDNYFSKNFGGKYFSNKSAKRIGYIREDIENCRSNLTAREYYVLIASLLYSIDKVANTVGHYETYFKKDNFEDNFYMRPINPIKAHDIEIFREDSNELAKKIEADVVYIDPPYNSRQYSRFYHILENLTKWEKPDLYGTALKPKEENMSDYCRVTAKVRLAELINDVKAKYLVVSYNNTYNSKSNSSKNKITLEEIENILNSKGRTKVFEKDYRHFNAGNTDFKNHKEYLFVTKVDHAEKI